jgi:hypothetical protein
MYLRQHGLMSFISLKIPEREINLPFVNSAGLIFQSITCHSDVTKRVGTAKHNNDKELTNGSFQYKLRGKQLWKGPK